MSYFPFRANGNNPINVTVTDTSVTYKISGGNVALITHLGAATGDPAANAPVYFAWTWGPDVVAIPPTWDGTDGSHILMPGEILTVSVPQNPGAFPSVSGIALITDSGAENQHVSIDMGEGN